MGTRIASLWKGESYTTGKMSSPTGFNIPAGHVVTVAIVRNEKHVEGDKLPTAFIEIWDEKPQS